MSDILSRIQAIEAQVRLLPTSPSATGAAPGLTAVTPVTLYSNSNPGAVSLTALNLAAYVPSTASIVELKIRGRSNPGATGWRYIHLRASSNGDDYIGWESTSAGVDTDTEGHGELGLFPISGQQIYYSVDNGIYDLVIRLYGYA